jgi:hypothetical protein
MRWLMWCGLVVTASVVSAFATHHFSRSHYLQLGKDNGSIDARVAVIREIDANLPRARVCSDSEYKDWKEIVSVKSGAVYVKPTSATSVLICRAH